MPVSRDDAAARLWWAVKRHVVLLGLLVVVAATAGAALAPPPPREVYQASALVIARELRAIRPEHLPRMALAIFSGGSVAEAAVESADLPIPAPRIIPRFAEVEPIEGTVLVRVNGYATDPRLATLVANAMAEALVDELNRAGVEVGTFAIQEEARRPIAPMPQGVRIPPTLLGILAGLMLGAGFVSLLVALRRPVLSDDEAVALADVPSLGDLRLSRSPRLDDPRRVIGTSALLKRLYPDRTGVCVLIALQGSRLRRSQVTGLVARGLSRIGTVRLVPADDRPGRRLASRLAQDPAIDVVDDLDGLPDPATPVVVDGPSADTMDVPQFLPADARPVLVVRQGVPTAAVLSASAQFLPGELYGVVFVRPRGRHARTLLQAVAGRRNRPAQVAVATGGQEPTETGPEGAAVAAGSRDDDPGR